MSKTEEPSNQAEDSVESTSAFVERLYQELRQTQERRYKLSVLKIGFVTALLGFGGAKFQSTDNFQSSLYLAPLVGELFDLLIMAQNYGIHRMGAFARIHLSDDWIEKKWQIFVRDNRSWFAFAGSWGFTILSYVAAIGLLAIQSKTPTDWKLLWLWFGSIFVLFTICRWVGRRKLKALEKDQSKS